MRPGQVEKIAGKKVTVVPILRAGIGMLDGVLSLIPGAKVSVVGVARNEETLEAHTYLERLVGELDQRLALIVDPMLATGGLHGRRHRPAEEGRLQGNPRALVLVAAPVGIDAVLAKHPDVHIYGVHRRPPERARLHRAGPGRRRRPHLRHDPEDRLTGSGRLNAAQPGAAASGGQALRLAIALAAIDMAAEPLQAGRQSRHLAPMSRAGERMPCARARSGRSFTAPDSTRCSGRLPFDQRERRPAAACEISRRLSASSWPTPM